MLNEQNRVYVVLREPESRHCKLSTDDGIYSLSGMKAS